jgi:hypothetical protein
MTIKQDLMALETTASDSIMSSSSRDGEDISNQKDIETIEGQEFKELGLSLSRRVTRTVGLVRQKMDDITESRPFEEQGKENDFDQRHEEQEKKVAQIKFTKHDVGWRYIVRNFTPS